MATGFLTTLSARRIRLAWVDGAAVALLALCLGRTLAADSVADPMRFVRAGVEQVIALFKDRQMQLAERRRKLREIAEQNFDFTDMARSALGYHWRTLSTRQRQAFVPLFTEFIEDAYLSKLQESTVREIEQKLPGVSVQYVGETFTGPDYAEVDTTLRIEKGRSPVEVNYSLRREAGGWKIYDVTLDSISVISNYRNQFNRIINNQGFDTLMADLQRKRQQLSALLDKR